MNSENCTGFPIWNAPIEIEITCIAYLPLRVNIVDTLPTDVEHEANIDKALEEINQILKNHNQKL